MRDYIDIAVVVYRHGVKELCYAPKFSLTEGNEVMTEHGTGVIMKTTTLEASNELLDMVKSVHKFDRVDYILKPMLYEVKIDDIPNQ